METTAQKMAVANKLPHAIPRRNSLFTMPARPCLGIVISLPQWIQVFTLPACDRGALIGLPHSGHVV